MVLSNKAAEIKRMRDYAFIVTFLFLNDTLCLSWFSFSLHNLTLIKRRAKISGGWLLIFNVTMKSSIRPSRLPLKTSYRGIYSLFNVQLASDLILLSMQGVSSFFTSRSPFLTCSINLD